MRTSRGIGCGMTRRSELPPRGRDAKAGRRVGQLGQETKREGFSGPGCLLAGVAGAGRRLGAENPLRSGPLVGISAFLSLALFLGSIHVSLLTLNCIQQVFTEVYSVTNIILGGGVTIVNGDRSSPCSNGNHRPGSEIGKLERIFLALAALSGLRSNHSTVP